MYVRARSRSLAHVCLEIVEGQSYKHSHLVCRDPEMSECDETSRGPLSIITTTSISPSRALRSLSSVVTRARLCQREREKKGQRFPGERGAGAARGRSSTNWRANLVIWCQWTANEIAVPQHFLLLSSRLCH